MTLPKKNRMTKRDFSKRFRSGKRIRGTSCSVQYGDIDGDVSKVAIVVQVKAATRSVERNRIRRVLSEDIGRLLPRFTRPVFLVVIVHAKPADPSLSGCRSALESVLIKSGIIK